MTLRRQRREVLTSLRGTATRLAHGDVGGALVAVAVSLGLAALVLRVWRADISAPIDTRGGDGLVFQMTVKALLDHGWYQTNHDLGFPLGQELYDFPAYSANNLHYAAMKVIGLFSANPAIVVNVYYLLGFALTALAAFLVARRMRISRPVAIVCAVVFTLLPDHFLRGEMDISLTQMFVMPVAAYLVLSVLAGDQLFARRHGTEGYALLRYASKRSLATLALAVAIGASNLYYASFTVILLCVAWLLRCSVERTSRGLVTTVALVAVIGGTLLLAFLPTVLYQHAHPPDHALFVRKAWESELLGLSITRLVTPISTHRIPALARLGKQYEQSTPTWGDGPLGHIGLISSGGLLALLAAALAGCMGARSGLLADRRLRHASVGAIVMLLVATVGGVSALIAYVLTPQLHDWGRAAPVIAFFSLVGIGVLLDRLGQRIGGSPRHRVGFLALLGAVVCFAVFDQTSNRFVPDYNGQAGANKSTDRLMRTIEHRLPAGAAVFQLPYEGFPEYPPRGRMGNYDSAIPYLHSHRLRWSYGAIRGRPADWAAALNDQPPAQILPAVAAVGFQGVLVDRYGYPSDHAVLEAQIERVSGARPLASPNGRYAFFDLRAYRDVQRRDLSPAEIAALREATLAAGKRFARVKAPQPTSAATFSSAFGLCCGMGDKGHPIGPVSGRFQRVLTALQLSSR